MKKVVRKTVSKDSKELATKADLNLTVGLAKTELNEKIETVKTELNEKIDVAEKILREEIRLTAEETVEKMDEKSRQYRDQILTKFDQFLGEITASREERVIISHRLNNHEERLVELESGTRISTI